MAELLGQRLARLLRGLDPLADVMQPRIRSALAAAPQLRNALDETWLRTPLHPALTDVPIGATTTAVLLDAAESVSGSADLATAADRALAVGVLGTVPLRSRVPPTGETYADSGSRSPKVSLRRAQPRAHPR
jgi:hypothetical protein